MDDLDKGAGWGQVPATAIQNTTVTTTGTTVTTGAQWCGRGMQVSAADERAAPAIEGGDYVRNMAPMDILSSSIISRNQVNTGMDRKAKNLNHRGQPAVRHTAKHAQHLVVRTWARNR